MTTPAQDFGEPWTCPDLGIVLKPSKKLKGGEVIVAQFEDHDDGARATACVNALKGCPDPQAFVKAAKAVLETAENYDRKDYDERGYHGEYVPDDTIDDEALAWLGEDKK